MNQLADEFKDMNNINNVRKELRRDTLSIKNRLQSIIHDHKFVKKATAESTFPVIPNERCGLWYVPPQEAADSAYFKSTDGHTNEWQFSMRRLNLHLVPLIRQNGGVIIVDSTRKGKSMPDALAKTIPIWCAVLNSIAFDTEEALDRLKASGQDVKRIEQLQANNWLVLPQLSKSEKSQITTRIPQMVAEVKRLNIISSDKLALDKPLVPQWVFPGNSEIVETQSSYSIVCLTASEKRADGDSRITVRRNLDDECICSWQYVQGSADDHELWISKAVCEGKLSPEIWWNHFYHSDEQINEQLIDNRTGYIHQWMSDEAVVHQLNSQWQQAHAAVQNNMKSGLDLTEIRDTGISFGKIEKTLLYPDIIESIANVKSLIVLSANYVIEAIPDKPSVMVCQYEIESSKKGSKSLRKILPHLIPKIVLPTIIACDTGQDLSVGVALILLCQQFNLNFERKPSSVNKDLIKQFLSEISGITKINPSRNTLQSVNSFLM